MEHPQNKVVPVITHMIAAKRAVFSLDSIFSLLIRQTMHHVRLQRINTKEEVPVLENFKDTVLLFMVTEVEHFKKC